jgi:hypothetical protein
MAQEIDHLLQLGLGLVLAGDVVERDFGPGPSIQAAARPAAPETKDAPLALNRLTPDPEQHQEHQQHGQAIR